jgi:hypothetical protein
MFKTELRDKFLPNKEGDKSDPKSEVPIPSIFKASIFEVDLYLVVRRVG